MNEAISRVDELMAQGDFARAHELLKDMPAVNAQLAAKKGRALNAIGQPEAALEMLDRALTLDPNCAEALGTRGTLHMQAGRAPEAEADLTRAIALAPEEPRYRCNRGFLFGQNGRLDEAFEDLCTCLSQGFENGTARLIRGQMLINRQQFEAAIEDLQAAVALGVPADSTRELESRCHEALGNLAQAIEAQRQSLMARPDSVEAWARLLKLEFDRSADCAQTILELGLNLHPEKQMFLQIFREFVQSTQSPEAAVRLLQQAAERLPDEVEVSVALGQALGQAGQNQQAVALLDQLIRRYPYCHSAWLNLGYLLEDAQALPYFEGAVAAGPTSAVNHYNLGSCLVRLGRCEDALVPLGRAIELDPEWFASYHERGAALDELHRYQEAIQDYDRCLELEPSTVRSWMNRGNTYRALGQYEKSLSDYQQAVSLQPDHHLARFNRAMALRDLGRHQEALQDLEQVVKLEPGFARGWYALGQTHKSLETQQHEAFYQRACQLDPQFLEHPYELPRRGPQVGTPPAAQRSVASDPLPTDDAAKLDFLAKASARCFLTVMPIFTRETLFSGLHDQNDLAALASYFTGWASFLAAREAGISNWLASPDYGTDWREMEQALAQDLANPDQDHRKLAVGCAVVSNFVDNLSDDMLPDCFLCGHLIQAAALHAGQQLRGHQHDPGLVDWSQRDQEYRQRIKAMGDGVNFSLDLDSGLYHWVRGQQTLAVADMTLLGLLGSDGSFLAGWADPQSNGPARPPVQMGLPGELHGVGQEEAWGVVTRAAERLGVDYIETRPTGNVVMFVGLTNMRAPGQGEEFGGFQESQAQQDVKNRLLDLRARLVSGELHPADLADLFRTYGETIQISGRTMYRDTPFAVRMVETGERVLKLGARLGQKKLFLFSRGKVPAEELEACGQELDRLLAEWGAEPTSVVAQLAQFWAGAARFIATNPSIFESQQNMFEAVSRGRSLETFIRRLQVGALLLHCGAIGERLQVDQTGDLEADVLEAIAYLAAHKHLQAEHVTSSWALDALAPGIIDRHDFNPLVAALTRAVVLMIQQMHEQE